MNISQRVAARHIEAASYSAMVSAVNQSLRKTKPTKKRKTTLDALAKELTKNQVLMDALYVYERDEGPHWDEILYKDWLGEPLASWKDGWGIGEYDSGGAEFESLGRDLVPYFKKALKTWKYTGKELRDYEVAQDLVGSWGGLPSILGKLSHGGRDEMKLLGEALGKAKLLVKELERLKRV